MEASHGIDSDYRRSHCAVRRRRLLGSRSGLLVNERVPAHARERERLSCSRDDPSGWRERAEGARVRAEKMSHPFAKQEMVEVAEGYERLAQLAEHRRQTGGVRRR